MKRFGLTKALGIALRVLIFAPAVMRLAASFDVFYISSAWLMPLSKFWYFPVFNGLFAVLCIMPYPDLLFRRRSKFVFLGLIMLACGFMLRNEFFPFHYAAPQVMSDPQLRQNFEQAVAQPLGGGYESSWTENQETLWLVHKPDWSALNILLFGTFYLVPLLLFLLRSYEIRHGIRWRSILDPHSTVGLPKTE